MTQFDADSFASADLDGPGGTPAQVYYVDISRSSDPFADQTGTLTGPNVYDIDQNVGLDVARHLPDRRLRARRSRSARRSPSSTWSAPTDDASVRQPCR